MTDGMFGRVVLLLIQLRDMLAASGEHAYLKEINSALEGGETALMEFIRSNTLWGGAGSIADQALSTSRETRRPLEQLLATLGREQLRVGQANTRTEMWTSVFEDWHTKSI